MISWIDRIMLCSGGRDVSQGGLVFRQRQPVRILHSPEMMLAHLSLHRAKRTAAGSTRNIELIPIDAFVPSLSRRVASSSTARSRTERALGTDRPHVLQGGGSIAWSFRRSRRRAIGPITRPQAPAPGAVVHLRPCNQPYPARHAPPRPAPQQPVPR